ncbi:MAG: pyruvate formate lyase-activating protein [Ruminococcaceae bacterium]|nr:pyruvate formate lyase-activating protein [Oscillospiraceae bacterium]
MKGYLHSIQSLGTVDGPGVRAVVFTRGCPLRCAYCHNPDTWEISGKDSSDPSEVAARLLRLYPYIKNGGVTFSGGEPCLQAKFLSEVARLLKERELHIALDTSGCILNAEVEELLSLCDLVLLDIKMTDEESYRRYTGGSLGVTLAFLSYLEEIGKEVWIRHVVVPELNDSEEDIERLCALVRPFKCVKKIELLPFKTLCVEKYAALGIEFPLKDTPPMGESRMTELRARLDDRFK